MKRRAGLGLLWWAVFPVQAETPALDQFIPLAQKELLAAANRHYRTLGLESRVVFMGRVRVLDNQRLQVRFVERWPYRSEGKMTLQMYLVDRVLSFGQAEGRWYVVQSSFQVQSLP